MYNVGMPSQPRELMRGTTLLLAPAPKRHCPGGGSGGSRTSSFVGVYWHGGERCWQAWIGYKGKQHSIGGRFGHEALAAHAYDCAAMMLYGPRAAVNFGAGHAHAFMRHFANDPGMRALEKLTLDSRSGSDRAPEEAAYLGSHNEDDLMGVQGSGAVTHGSGWGVAIERAASAGGVMRAGSGTSIGNSIGSLALTRSFSTGNVGGGRTSTNSRGSGGRHAGGGSKKGTKRSHAEGGAGAAALAPASCGVFVGVDGQADVGMGPCPGYAAHPSYYTGTTSLPMGYGGAPSGSHGFMHGSMAMPHQPQMSCGGPAANHGVDGAGPNAAAAGLCSYGYTTAAPQAGFCTFNSMASGTARHYNGTGQSGVSGSAAVARQHLHPGLVCGGPDGLGLAPAAFDLDFDDMYASAEAQSAGSAAWGQRSHGRAARRPPAAAAGAPTMGLQGAYYALASAAAGGLSSVSSPSSAAAPSASWGMQGLSPDDMGPASSALSPYDLSGPPVDQQSVLFSIAQIDVPPPALPQMAGAGAFAPAAAAAAAAAPERAAACAGAGTAAIPNLGDVACLRDAWAAAAEGAGPAAAAAPGAACETAVDAELARLGVASGVGADDATAEGDLLAEWTEEDSAALEAVMLDF